jgi:hypothetical protein
MAYGLLLPHPPQLFSSLVVSTQAPSQFVKPALHDTSVQTPFEQAAVPLSKWQTCPHEPQLLTSVCRATQVLPHCV